MKFDVNILKYIDKDAWRTLVAVEMGMKNHELVPVELVNAISGLKHGGAYKWVRDLLKHKLAGVPGFHLLLLLSTVHSVASALSS